MKKIFVFSIIVLASFFVLSQLKAGEHSDPTSNVQVFTRELSDDELFEAWGIEKTAESRIDSVVLSYSFK